MIRAAADATAPDAATRCLFVTLLLRRAIFAAITRDIRYVDA